MKILLNIIRRYPLSCLCIAVIWVLCLIPIPETPLSDICLIDKWTHLVMYGGLCTLLWLEYGLHHRGVNKKLAFLWIVAAPIFMGALLEVAQATCTGGTRSGDLLDWVADTIGVVLGQIIGIPLARFASTRNKG